MVEGFVRIHGDSCARIGLSLSWCILGLIFSLLGAVAYNYGVESAEFIGQPGSATSGFDAKLIAIL